tara:strand:- start:1317 stop:1643 length:327 start_codon:yes stop_codon:yes gene_type:complete
MNLLTSVFLLIATVLIIGGSFLMIFLINNPDVLNNELTEQSCTDAGARWNTCGSKCQILNVNNPEVACVTVCENICECGTIAGLGCPDGYNCVLPSGISDAGGYCEKE